MRQDPFTGHQTMHNGTDYAPAGHGNVPERRWPLHAVEAGTVVQSFGNCTCTVNRSCGQCGGRGNFVVINHPRIGRELHYFHMHRVDVRQGQTVSAGQIVGTTGTTGRSTAIHLHLGLRPSGGGAWQDPHAFVYTPPGGTQPAAPPSSLNIDTIAREVIRGAWGNGDDRRRRLAAAGHDPAAVQRRVNELLQGTTQSVDAIAREVIAGRWGNGAERVRRLTANGHDPQAVQARVNEILRGGA